MNMNAATGMNDVDDMDAIDSPLYAGGTEGAHLSFADALQFVSAAANANDGTGPCEPGPYNHYAADTSRNANHEYSSVYRATPDGAAASVLDTDTRCCAFYSHPMAPVPILPFIVGAVVAMFFSANGWCVGHVVAMIPEPDFDLGYVYSVSIKLSEGSKMEIYVNGKGELSYSTSRGVVTRIASTEVVVLSHMQSVP